MEKIQNKALRASRIGLFAALYAITSLVPISVFLGASSLLTLNLLVTPAIAILLTPIEAGFTALIGAILALYLAPFQAIFGIPTILLPVAGAFLGSLTYHKFKLGIITSIYLGVTSVAFIIKIPEFPYWVALHVTALVLAATSKLFTSRKIRIPVHTFIATMAEQATMMMLATYVLQLPWFVFAMAFPLMVYERFIGTIGGALIVYAFLKTASQYLIKT